MKNIFNIIQSAVFIMTPLLFASAGGLFTELSGMLNIALEGLLLAGAFSAIAAIHYTGSFAAGIAAAVFVSVSLSALHAFSSLKLKSNVFISGLAVNLLAGGLTIVFSNRFFNTRGVVIIDGYVFPLFNYFFICTGLFLLFAAWFVIYKTPFGYRLRACGMDSLALSSLGIKTDRYRFFAFIICGFFCGIGGAFLSLKIGAFVPNISAGKGWIALVIIFLGRRRPLGLIIAAFVFSLAESFSNYAQGALAIPADFILAMPYLLTFFAMVFVSIAVKRKNRVM